PIWQLDLVGRDLNITEIRRTVLALFGDNVIVQDIFDIVRGGMAKAVTYVFKGRAVDFEYLKYQVITAQAADAQVHIPDAKLTLDGVNGLMRIEEGTLYVTEANGTLGQSKGKNCALKFNLLDHVKNPPFTLDVDIDAEATDLVRTLHDLVPYEDFRQELLQLTNVEGTGSGHLHIGHTLQDFDVHVDVKAMDVKGRYGRLASPFHIQKGTMKFEPNRLSWTGVLGSLGNHRIHSLTGSVEWQHEPYIRINNVNAAINGESLMADLKHYKVVADYLAPILTSLSGELQLNKGTFEGPALDHEKWRYSGIGTLKNAGWKSPRLDGAPVTGHSGEIIFNDKEITLSRNEARFQKGGLTAHGVLHHQLLADWQGNIEFSGTLTEAFGPWLRNQGWLPRVALPRLPAKVQGVRLDWDDKNFIANGVLIAGGVSLNKPPQLAFTVKTTEQNPLNLALDLEDQDRHGRLHLDLLDQNPETFQLTWQGEAQGSTLKRLLADSSLLTGAIKGHATIAMPAEPEPPSVNGQVVATGLRLPLDESSAQFLGIKELNMSGGHGKAMVQRLTLALNEQEQLSLKGEVQTAPGGLTLALTLTSPQLSRKTAVDFLDQLKKLRGKAAKPGKIDKKTGRTITGT
ncbi:MAG TPA: hypothetical protein VLL73_05615, partial [Desulfurivibrionaceae bacterium]|nr:hypothetical protein [Desulfurivibrionaceae bacterium]